ncbi:MAG TPA: DUF5615 family PIN-like protein [Phnomibacter sp.]|nr:DUF5615 family PIN-like protein [Phnomibacter sp.]
MKILLDECVTKKLKGGLSDLQVSTVREMGWGGIKNGRLMELCVKNGFEILLTIDKNMMFQQNLEKFELTIVVLNSYTSKVEELKTFLPTFLSQFNSFEKKRAYLIDREL